MQDSGPHWKCCSQFLDGGEQKNRRKVRFMVCRVRWIFHHVARGLCKRGGVNRGKQHGAAATTATQTPTHSGHNTQFKDDKTTARAPTRALSGIVAIIAESFIAIAPVTPVEVRALPSLATQLRGFCLCAFVSVCAGEKKRKRNWIFYLFFSFQSRTVLCCCFSFDVYDKQKRTKTK